MTLPVTVCQCYPTRIPLVTRTPLSGFSPAVEHRYFSSLTLAVWDLRQPFIVNLAPLCNLTYALPYVTGARKCTDSLNDVDSIRGIEATSSSHPTKSSTLESQLFWSATI